MADFFAKGKNPINGYGGAQHGLYKVWTNPNPTSTFAGQTISVTTDLVFDEMKIQFGDNSDRIRLTLSVEAEYTSIATLNTQGTNGEVNQYSRNIATSKTSTGYSFIISDCGRRRRTNEGTTSESTVNTTLIPRKIVGIIYH